jgi:hypothetical protein
MDHVQANVRGYAECRRSALCVCAKAVLLFSPMRHGNEQHIPEMF